VRRGAPIVSEPAAQDTVRVRFAPAPTGYLHLGGARTALFNWLFARHHRGTFILRIEDTDIERSREDVIGQVLESLRWLGLDWDEGPDVGGHCGPYFQSERRAMHVEHAERLLREGKAFECYMTPEELEVRRKEAIAAGRPFRYEGWHRDLTPGQAAAFRAEGRKPALRLRVDAPAEGFLVDDLIKGPTHFPPEQMDDFVLLRSDGTPSFHLANVVDDATMCVTHVIRGEDHLTNTVRHQLLFDAFGYPRPRYGHLPMILGPDRSKLSKRHGAVSVMEYKEQGYLPEALVNELALLGWSAPDGQERFTREELIKKFDLSRVGHSGSIFDFAKLDHFNGLLIREMPREELAKKLDPFLGEAANLPREKLMILIDIVVDTLAKLSDFPNAAQAVLCDPHYAPEVLNDAAMAKAAPVLDGLISEFEAMPEPWEREAVKAKLKDAGKKIGAKGKELFFPLRGALTGSLHGPSLDGVVVLLGKKECLLRMRGLREKLDR
jgi:nondiscriminating glutamyl-tRNA synthetase